MTCMERKFEVDGFVVVNPDIAIFALGGALTGFLSFINVLYHRTKLRNHEVYMILFFLFGCMNTSGLFINSLTPRTGSQMSTISFIMMTIDRFCSSAVSLTFIYCGLVDVGLLKDKSWSLRIVLLLNYMILWYWWNHDSATRAFDLLYTGLTEVGSLAYFVMSFITFYKFNSWRGWQWIALAGLSGLSGVLILQGKLGDLCINSVRLPLTSSYISVPNGEAIWYLFSDLSLLFFSIFYITSKWIPSRVNDTSADASEKIALLESFS
eukprot:TRINITY_DN3635_c0_g1_i1.p1 TRINITY_DN3635_c0_g1~~TRINITY_DN3635_c0_g1_i1.p1  ORF type:complete len:287 (+),score=59.66 TRINITY_DN3635_c0_g1_i1:65-862(+)